MNNLIRTLLVGLFALSFGWNAQARTSGYDNASSYVSAGHKQSHKSKHEKKKKKVASGKHKARDVASTKGHKDKKKKSKKKHA
jgi:hypothetical protein